MIATLGRRAAVAGRAATRLFDYGQGTGITAAAHGSMGQAGVQGQAIAAMAEHTTEGFSRVAGTDFFDTFVTGQA
jgi:hypothetical protein